MKPSRLATVAIGLGIGLCTLASTAQAADQGTQPQGAQSAPPNQNPDMIQDSPDAGRKESAEPTKKKENAPAPQVPGTANENKADPTSQTNPASSNQINK